MPSVARFMSMHPITIDRRSTLAVARRLMHGHAIRHLPVVDGDRLVGIVSERDLHLIETLPDSDPDEVTVDDAMTETVYIAAPTDDVSEVVDRMAAGKLGSAVVMQDQSVEGIFTSIDALQVLSHVLRRTVAAR